jgi:hypothetical protein
MCLAQWVDHHHIDLLMCNVPDHVLDHCFADLRAAFCLFRNLEFQLASGHDKLSRTTSRSRLSLLYAIRSSMKRAAIQTRPCHSIERGGGKQRAVKARLAPVGR